MSVTNTRKKEMSCNNCSPYPTDTAHFQAQLCARVYTSNFKAQLTYIEFVMESNLLIYTEFLSTTVESGERRIVVFPVLQRNVELVTWKIHNPSYMLFKVFDSVDLLQSRACLRRR